jgi:hypothetical protein
MLFHWQTLRKYYESVDPEVHTKKLDWLVTE